MLRPLGHTLERIRHRIIVNQFQRMYLRSLLAVGICAVMALGKVAIQERKFIENMQILTLVTS